MQSENILEVSSLSKTFHVRGYHTVALSPCSFTVPAGGSLGIVGESGSGKSTLVRLIAGLEKPTTGTVTLLGAVNYSGRNHKNRRDQAQRVQMVFQDPFESLDPRQRLGDCLREVIAVHGVRRGRSVQEYTSWLLERVGLDPEMAGAYPRSLSGGQRQRFSIARALAPQPHVLILDEAVSALDVSVQAQILRLLDGLRKETGITYLFVTHDLAVVRQVCDTGIVLRKGEIVERGTVSALLDDPQHDYTQRLIASVPVHGWAPPSRRELRI